MALYTGFFSSIAEQPSCLQCEDLGDFFQESAAQTFCVTCPTATRRYLGVLSAANRTACQCKEGVATPRRTARRVSHPVRPVDDDADNQKRGLLRWSGACCRLLQRALAGWRGAAHSALLGPHGILSAALVADECYCCSGVQGMCDSSISNPSIVANPRRASVAVQMFANGQSILEWHFADLLQALLGFAVTASCHSRSVSVRSADRSMQHCLSCAINTT